MKWLQEMLQLDSLWQMTEQSTRVSDTMVRGRSSLDDISLESIHLLSFCEPVNDYEYK